MENMTARKMVGWLVVVVVFVVVVGGGGVVKVVGGLKRDDSLSLLNRLVEMQMLEWWKCANSTVEMQMLRRWQFKCLNDGNTIA